MKTYIITCAASIILFASCNSHTKKIIVYANTDAKIAQDTKTITEKETQGHVEKELQYNTGDKVVLKIQAAAGEKDIEIPEDGYYIVNAKANDTIVGGYQKYTSAQEANKMMTQDQLKHNIDSLQQMVQGQNISADNRTFFILPNTAAKISSNTDATVVGPYHQMTSIAQTGDKAPEVYRFFSIKEVRETIDKLVKLTK